MRTLQEQLVEKGLVKPAERVGGNRNAKGRGPSIQNGCPTGNCRN
ncbi:hypothetical protein MKY41_08395 [Sporosarcina sp. FSL W7-1349]